MARTEDTSSNGTSSGANHVAVDASSPSSSPPHPRDCLECCYGRTFRGIRDAQGFAWLGAGRGTIIIANMFLSSSLLYLATMESIETGRPKLYGFTPSSLITNIAVISGLASAFCMPVIGAMIDFTPYRKQIGIFFASVLVAIQAVQVGTNARTWFVMAVFQAVAGFVFQVHLMTNLAYLPEILRQVHHDEPTMGSFTSKFGMAMITTEFLFAVVITVLNLSLGWGAVLTAQVSQAANAITIAVCFAIAWRRMSYPPAPMPLIGADSSAKRGGSEATARRGFVQTVKDVVAFLPKGFQQNWRTAKMINTQYKHGLRWFLVATVFAEASCEGLASVTIVYLIRLLGLSSGQIGIFTVLALLVCLPGAWASSKVAAWTDPKWSFCICMMGMIVSMTAGAIGFDNEYSKQHNNVAYVWSVTLGFFLGWYHPAQNLFLSLCQPHAHHYHPEERPNATPREGQPATVDEENKNDPQGDDPSTVVDEEEEEEEFRRYTELTGFFVYSSQILAWVAPMLFTVIVESDVDMKWGVIVAEFGFFVAIFVLLCVAAPWDVIVREAAEVRWAGPSSAAGPGGVVRPPADPRAAAAEKSAMNSMSTARTDEDMNDSSRLQV